MTVWLALVALALGVLRGVESGRAWIAAAPSPRSPAFQWRLRGLVEVAGIAAWGCLALYLAHHGVSAWWPLAAAGGCGVLGVAVLLRRMGGVIPGHTHDAPSAVHARPRWVTRHEAGTADGPHVTLAKGMPGGGVGEGLLPSPAALAVLLAVAAAHDRSTGLVLLAAFAAGLVGTLIAWRVRVAVARSPQSLQRMVGWSAASWVSVLIPLLLLAIGGLLAAEGFAEVHRSGAGFAALLPGNMGLGKMGLGNMGRSGRGLDRSTLGPVFLAGLGLLLGMRHSTDADHVVAISTIVSKQRGIWNAALIGSMWGIGHTITIFAVGALIILAGITIPPRVGLAMEFSVALMLILLGCLNLTGVTARLMRRLSPGAATFPDAAGLELAEGEAKQGWVGRLGLFHLLRPLAIGLVHGLAGSAAVALLVLSTIHSPVWATIYLLIFGFGTVLGMMIMTSAMAVPLTYAGSRSTRLSRYFGITSGLISVCFGLFLVYQLGYVGGLFSSHPRWTPQ